MPLLSLHSIPPSSPCPALSANPLSSPFLPRKLSLSISSWHRITSAHFGQQQDGHHRAISPRIPLLAGLQLTRCVEQGRLESRLNSDTILARFLLPKAGTRKKILNIGEQLENTEETGNHERWTIFLLSFLRVSRILPLIFLAAAVVFSSRSPAVAASQRGPSVVVAPKATNHIQVLHLFTSGWAGFMAGCLHALTGLDHLAALAPLCIGRAKLESAAIGALWGCGHDAGQVIFGLVFLLLKDKLHIELVRTWAARIVGVTLLSIGVLGIKEAQELPVSVLAGAGGINAESGEAANGRKNDARKLRTFATGLVYGLQPDALIMVLPALALPTRLAGASYLAMFLLGTVIAMASYTAFIGSCGEALQKKLPWITRRLSIGSSLIAMAFGIGVLLGEFLGINFF